MLLAKPDYDATVVPQQCAKSTLAQQVSSSLLVLSLVAAICGLSGCTGCLAPKTSVAEPEEVPTTSTSAPSGSVEATVNDAGAEGGLQVEKSVDSVLITEGGVDEAPADEGSPLSKNDSDAVTSKEGSGSDSDQSGGRQRGTPSGLTVEKTVAAVSTLRDKARRAEAQNDPGKAFELYVEALDAARAYPRDIQLRTAAQEITAELDSLGQQLNGRFESKAQNSSVRLIEK